MIRPRPFAALLTLTIGLACASCGAPMRPALLGDAEKASRSPASVEASQLVPQAFARAQQLRGEADAAYARGELPSALILAERSLAAFEHAAVLAEIVRAMRVAETAREQLTRSEELRDLDAEQARLEFIADSARPRPPAAPDLEDRAARIDLHAPLHPPDFEPLLEDAGRIVYHQPFGPVQFHNGCRMTEDGGRMTDDG